MDAFREVFQPNGPKPWSPANASIHRRLWPRRAYKATARQEEDAEQRVVVC